MGKHSAHKSGSNPFSRKHGHLTKGTGSREKVRTLDRFTRVERGAGERLGSASARKRGSLEVAPSRLKKERKRREHRIRHMFAIAGVVVAVFVLLAATGVYGYAKYIENRMQNAVGNKGNLGHALKSVAPQKPFTILLLGGDDKPGTPKHRTDTMILAKVDPKNKRVWLLSIPRDTRVDLPGYGHVKINSAYFHGGPQLAIEAVSDFTGMEINHYMEVDFRGFKEAVDAIGGVWVDVPTEIDDPKAAGLSYKRAAAHIDAGYQLLDGDHALVFVRSRKYADADFGRIRSQQVFFKALADQIASRANLAKLPRVVMSVYPHIGTDMSLMQLIRTAQALKSAGSKNIYTATVQGEWKSPFVYTDEENMKLLLERMNEGRSFDDTTAPAPAVSSPSSPSTSGSKTVRPSEITVDVRNGAGIVGCAKQASSVLKARSFKVGEVGNAGQFVYEQTLIVYKSNQEAAEKVAEALPPGAKIVESRGMYSFKGDVLVVIGKDWNLSDLPVAPIVP